MCVTVPSQCILRSELSLPKSKRFSIYDEEKRLLLQANQDPITEGLDSFLNDFTFIPFTISFKDKKGREIFSLHKKRSTPFSGTNFVIIFSQGRVQVQEGKKFQKPNLTMKVMDRQIDLVGRVMDLVFYLKEGDQVLATFQGKRTKEGKDYYISMEDSHLPREIYLASAIILDNLYHDY